MERRTFLKALAGGALAAGTGGPAWAAPRRPNIVVILADDMGFSDIGCYGSEISTPNIDGLARQGVRFTQFYNNARCCPSRASLLTGLYPHQTGIGLMEEDQRKPGYEGELNMQCVTLAEALRPAGYRTLMCGKWHVTHNDRAHDNDKHDWPLQRGFDRYYGTIIGAGSYYDPAMLTDGNEFVQPDRKDYYYTDALADRAVSYIGEYAKKAEPFFLYAAFTAPHWPLHAFPEDIGKYKDRYKNGWDALRAERHERQAAMGIVDRRWPLTPRDPRVPAWADAPNKEWEARRMAVYAAQVDRLDRNVGRILAKLRETGVEDNTLVMFLADNGGCAEELTPSWKYRFIPSKTRDGRPVRLGNDPNVMPGPEDTYQSYGLPWANASNTPFRLYKHWIHEGGISTPFIARWPLRMKRTGTLTSQTGHIIDLMATCVDVGGAKYPSKYNGNDIKPLEGRSLAPVFEGKQREPHPEICWEHEGNRAIREGKWKLVSRYPQEWELHDMEADRTEMNDLAASQPERVKAMAERWRKWADRCNVLPWDEVRKLRG
jgi:arylsulfatase A-like enzyme